MKFATVGAGPAGLYFSLLMKQADPGHRVVVYERNPRNHVAGWGMGFWGWSWDDLISCLEDSDPTTARRLQERAVRWRGQSLTMDGETAAIDGVGYGIHHRTLVEILTDRALEVGVEINFDHALTDTDQIRDADVVIAADGVGSVIRGKNADQFGTECIRGRNTFVWLGSDKVFEGFTNSFVPTDHGWIWLHGYAIDPGTSVCIIECAPQTWRGLGLDTLPATESLRLLESIFGSVLDGRGLLSHGSDTAPLCWQNFRTISNRRWWSGNTVLIGDAAHTAHFSIGSGTRLALRGAAVLAAALNADVAPQQAFMAYQRHRHADVVATQRDACFSSRWLEDVDRYIGKPAEEFFTLYRARRDPLVAQIPTALYYRLYSVAERNPLLRRLKAQVGPRARRRYGQLVRTSR